MGLVKNTSRRYVPYHFLLLPHDFLELQRIFSGDPLSLHSQTTKVLIPAADLIFFCRLSLSRFFSNFADQKSAFDLGRSGLQYVHLCQKQPLSRAAKRSLEKYKSGLPLIRLSFFLYPRKPAFQIIFAITFQGIVPTYLLESMDFVTAADTCLFGTTDWLIFSGFINDDISSLVEVVLKLFLI